jgi:2-polyprenyl-6-methoxyphenol hydroxylase-like FAD-dependent oxidoreductase
MEWRIVELSKVPRWSTPDGKVILVGDACHAMLPYASTRTSQGLEDAAVLAELLRHASLKRDLGVVSKLYYELRHKRVEKARDLARMAGRWFSMVDGPEQRNRDLFMMSSKRREIDPDYVDPSGEVSIHAWLDDFDVVKRLVRWRRHTIWARLSKRSCEDFNKSYRLPTFARCPEY